MDFVCARRTPEPLFMEWSAALRHSSTESRVCEYLENSHCAASALRGTNERGINLCDPFLFFLIMHIPIIALKTTPKSEELHETF